MDRNNSRISSTTTTPITTTTSQIYPFVLGHHISAYSSALNTDSPHNKATQLPSSGQNLAGAHLPYAAAYQGEDGALPPVLNMSGSGLGNRVKPPEPEPDGYDCESEEGVELADDPTKSSAAGRRSGSKRSRAAEVHNLSEKRRRSRINEKMKALQKLIPNSNKTDKASMLDEAIDYLKQLQLQVQMLSMRNGLSLNSPFMPPSLQSLQPPQMRFNSESAPLMNVGMGMVPLDPPNSSSFGLPNRGVPSSHQTLVTGTSSISDPIVSFAMGSSQAQHGFFHLPAVNTEGLFADETLRPQLNASEAIRSASLHFDGQPQIPNANQVSQARILNGLSSQEGLPMDQSNPIHMQHG